MNSTRSFDVDTDRTSLFNIELKHDWELRLADFKRYPFWICCELEDENQPWYAQIEPSMFRPYSHNFPRLDCAVWCGRLQC